LGESTGVVNRVATVLRVIAERAVAGASTTDVARHSGIPRPSAHRLLQALHTQGLVDRDHQSGRWYLGPEVYILGAAAAPRFDVTEKAVQCVHRLAIETGESAFFSLRRGDHTVVMLQEDGDFPIRSHVLHEGARFPLGVVSAGLAVLAYLSDDYVQRYLDRVDLVTRWGQAHSTAAIRNGIAETRRRGWATNPGLVVPGSWGMAAAVFDASRSPIGALTVTGIEQRFGDDRRDGLGQLLLRESNFLSKLIVGAPR
jgi:IclR family transcriptional regulator, acetate operon repressor